MLLEQWRQHYQQALQMQSAAALDAMSARLKQTNPRTVLLRPAIEAIWAPIMAENDWEPFYALLQRIRQPFDG